MTICKETINMADFLHTDFLRANLKSTALELPISQILHVVMYVIDEGCNHKSSQLFSFLLEYKNGLSQKNVFTCMNS